MYHSMKTYWEVEIQLVKFTSILDTGEYLTSRSGRYAPPSPPMCFYGRLWDHRAELNDVTCLIPMSRSSTMLPSYCNARAMLAILTLIHNTHNSEVLQKYIMIIICAYRILNHKYSYTIWIVILRRVRKLRKPTIRTLQEDRYKYVMISRWIPIGLKTFRTQMVGNIEGHIISSLFHHRKILPHWQIIFDKRRRETCCHILNCWLICSTMGDECRCQLEVDS